MTLPKGVPEPVSRRRVADLPPAPIRYRQSEWDSLFDRLRLDAMEVDPVALEFEIKTEDVANFRNRLWSAAKRYQETKAITLDLHTRTTTKTSTTHSVWVWVAGEGPRQP